MTFSHTLDEEMRQFTEHGGSLSFREVPDLVGLPGIHIEAKRVGRLNIGETMWQAIRDAERFRDDLPALLHRRNRQPWFVTLRLDDFMNIFEASRR